MRTEPVVRRRAAMLVASLGLAMSAAAIAQQPAPVTVRGTALSAKVVGTLAGVPIVLTTLTRGVAYSGLDLTTHSGVFMLERRVRSTARRLCGRLDAMFPLERPQARSCTRKAVAGAMRQVRLAIADSRGHESRG